MPTASVHSLSDRRRTEAKIARLTLIGPAIADENGRCVSPRKDFFLDPPLTLPQAMDALATVTAEGFFEVDAPDGTTYYVTKPFILQFHYASNSAASPDGMPSGAFSHSLHTRT